MSLEITFYPKTSTKNKLIKLLKDNEFERTQHIIESFNDDKHIHFMWYGLKNFESFSGVEATIIKIDKEEATKKNCSSWVLHTRTRSGGSRIDKQRQNKIIKKARKIFKGSFYNDWYGTNKYTILDDYDNLSAPERGLFLMYENLHEKINKLRNCIESYENPVTKNLESMGNDGFAEFMKMKDPSVVLFNSLLPFAVSLIEYFFGNTFEILITYDKKAQEIIENENLKVPLKDVILVKKGEISIESIVSRDFTFQNLSHVNKAYRKYLNIDILKTLSKRKKVGNRIFRIREKLEEIVSRRHLMIHHFDFDYSLKESEFIEILDVIEATIRLIVKSIENKNNWNIRRYE